MTCYTALITPFKEEKLDIDGLGYLIQRQVAAEIDGLALLGTTGENPTLYPLEKKKILQIARQEARKMSLMVGVGTNATRSTLENIGIAADAGADSLLVIAPYYNRPTQDGIFEHYSFLAASSPLPILIYNHPGRTGVNIELETLERLSHIPQIIGIKESSDHLMQLAAEIFKIKRMRPDFLILTGNDHMTLPVMSMGGDGVISVVSNLAPIWMKKLVQACKMGDFEKARDIYSNMLPLFEVSAIETNPIPIKAALELAELPAGDPRLPLTPLSQKWLSTLSEVLEQFPFYEAERSVEGILK